MIVFKFVYIFVILYFYRCAVVLVNCTQNVFGKLNLPPSACLKYMIRYCDAADTVAHTKPINKNSDERT